MKAIYTLNISDIPTSCDLCGSSRGELVTTPAHGNLFLCPEHKEKALSLSGPEFEAYARPIRAQFIPDDAYTRWGHHS